MVVYILPFPEKALLGLSGCPNCVHLCPHTKLSSYYW